MGAGTGRVTRLIAPYVKSVFAFDRSIPMLNVAQRRANESGHHHVVFGVADNAALPMPDQSADGVIEGWSFGHATEWHTDRWQDAIDGMLNEIMRVLRPGGTALLIETMGTGVEQSAPPNDVLAALYHWWETEHGFEPGTVRTDYRFDSIQEAVDLTGFFFGDEMRAHVQANSWLVLPEWTGIWRKVKR